MGIQKCHRDFLTYELNTTDQKNSEPNIHALSFHKNKGMVFKLFNLELKRENIK